MREFFPEAPVVSERLRDRAALVEFLKEASSYQRPQLERESMWLSVLRDPSLPVTEKDLDLFRGPCADGPPSARVGVAILAHPAAGIRVRRSFGWYVHLRFSSDKWDKRGKVAVASLRSDPDPVGQVALFLGLFPQPSKNNLLAEAVGNYTRRFDQVADPAHGGSPARVETLLGLKDSSRVPSWVLADMVVKLVP